MIRFLNSQSIDLTCYLYLLAITVMFNQSMYSVDENSGPVQPALILSNPSSNSVTVQVITTDGSATGA